MSGPELAEAAEALFGPPWRSAAASALGVSRETLWRHVASGPTAEVAAVVGLWRRLAGHGVAPPPFPDGSFASLPADAPCQGSVAPDALAGVASDLLGPGWRDEVCRACGLSRNGLWRQVAMGRVSGPLLAWLRGRRALAGLEAPLATVVAPARKRQGRRPAGYASHLP